MRIRLSPAATLLLLLLFFLAFAILRSHQPAPRSSERRTHSIAPREPSFPPYGHESRRREYSRREPQQGEDRRAREGDEQLNEDCQALEVSCSSEYFAAWQQPREQSCAARPQAESYPLPDPHCTPGGINTSITAEVLRDPRFRTRCTRNCQVSEAAKHEAYSWYGIVKPRPNSGESQVCELDHLVPLELGGADGPGNVWPECGPDATALDQRYFKIKDRVENYLADEVKAGRMSLSAAQRGIATDWTRFLPAADRYCEAGGRC